MEKPESQFNKQAASKDGLTPYCRECQRQRFADYSARRWGGERRARAEARAARLESPRKTCPRCAAEKPKSEFYKDKRRPDGLYAWCKECFRAHGRATYDPARDRARRQAKADDPEYRARTYARVKKWRAENPERYGLLARGYASQRRTTPSGRPVDLAAVLAEHGMWCYLCESDIESLDVLHFDHVTPLSRDGVHEEDNLRPTHARCNLRKHARLPEEMPA